MVSYTECPGQYSWFNSYTGQDYVGMARLAIDANNNLFTVSNFSQDVTIKNQKLTGGGALLVKLSNEGEVIWFNRFTYSNAMFTSVTQVQVDGQGNVYMVGQFPESANIGGTTITGGQFNSFLAKFNSDGVLLWIKKFNLLQEIFQLSVNQTGDIGISGVFFQSLTIDNITLTASFNSFGALFNSDGQLQWAKVFGADAAYTNFPVSLTLDQAGNYFFCGRYSGRVTIDNKQVSADGVGHYNIYYVKINKQGNCEWLVDALRNAPDSYQISNPPFNAVTELASMTTDEEGNLYAAGTFWIDMKIQGHTLSSNDPQPENFYVTKINSDGSVIWIEPKIISYGNNTVENIIVKNEKVFTSGIYQGAPYYKIMNSESGRLIKDIETFPLSGDIANGLAIDDNEGVYMSGRSRNGLGFQSGYIFKVGVSTSIADAGAVLAIDDACFHDNLTVTTTPIFNADNYQWEITYNGNTEIIQTNSPLVQIPIHTMGDATHVSIRVRGINAEGAGKYSSVKNVNIILFPEVPEIKIECDEIQVVKGDLVTWYEVSKGLLNYSEGTKKISKIEKGKYYVINTNLCGSISGNTVDFKPLFIPNIITPNDDFKNDTFVLDQRLEGSQLKIINRWGEGVYESVPYENDWNGKNLPTGVYFYSIDHYCFKSSALGWLTISR
jgi:gliding motility-associated-like protein